MANSGTGWTAIAIATAIGLAGASASQITQATGQSVAVSSSTAICDASTGDPHETLTIGGISNTFTTSYSSNNLVTFDNTNKGATVVASTVSGYGKKTVNQGTTAETYYNSAFVVTHATSNLSTSWAVSIQEIKGSVKTILQDSTGTHVLAQGNSFVEADGSIISSPVNYKGTAVNITQNLSSGGVVTSHIQQNTYNGAYFLDLNQTSTGTVVMNGDIVDNLTGTKNSAIVAQPVKACSYSVVAPVVTTTPVPVPTAWAESTPIPTPPPVAPVSDQPQTAYEND